MKKIAFMILFLAVNMINAQEGLFQKIKTELKKEYPEIKLENKVLAVNVWSSNDLKSREANKELNKTINTFGYAKLKGGAAGIIGVTINIDSDKNSGEIALKKDKVEKTMVIDKGTMNLAGISTIVFDKDGNIIYKELEPSLIFSFIHNLITR